MKKMIFFLIGALLLIGPWPALADGAPVAPPGEPLIRQGPAEEPAMAPETPEDRAVARIEAESAARVEALAARLETVTDPEQVRQLVRLIEAEKQELEVRILMTQLDFAEAARDEARVNALLVRLDELLDPEPEQARGVEAVRPSLLDAARRGPGSEEGGA